MTGSTEEFCLLLNIHKDLLQLVNPLTVPICSLASSVIPGISDGRADKVVKRNFWVQKGGVGMTGAAFGWATIVTVVG